MLRVMGSLVVRYRRIDCLWSKRIRVTLPDALFFHRCASPGKCPSVLVDAQGPCQSREAYVRTCSWIEKLDITKENQSGPFSPGLPALRVLKPVYPNGFGGVSKLIRRGRESRRSKDQVWPTWKGQDATRASTLPTDLTGAGVWLSVMHCCRHVQ
jgi:hypothetical protein